MSVNNSEKHIEEIQVLIISKKCVGQFREKHISKNV